MKKPALLMFHLLFWIFTSLLIILVFQLMSASSWVIHQSKIGFTIGDHLKGLAIVLPAGGFIFYASYFSLPFFTKRFVRFGWLCMSIIVFVITISIPGYLAQRASGHKVEIDHVQGLLGTTLIVSPILYFLVLGFLFRVFIEWFKDRKIKAELEKDKVTSQLALLKSKLNPHFLFNTLNNIDVFIQDNPEKASLYLRKLSDILRFMLFESDAEKISLSKELDYIGKYTELQKIRTSNANFVNLQITGDPNDKLISPMILIHFIENAFKYATNKKIENAVSISFTISKDTLLFQCKNHVHEPKVESSEKNGMGVKLLVNKLELLYRNTYRLTTREENSWYFVNLEIPLG